MAIVLAAVLGVCLLLAWLASRDATRPKYDQLHLSREEMKMAILACDEYLRGHIVPLDANPVRLVSITSESNPTWRYGACLYRGDGEFYYSFYGEERYQVLEMLASKLGDISDYVRPDTKHLRQSPRNEFNNEMERFEVTQ